MICRRGNAQADDSSSKTISDSTWALIVGGAILVGLSVYVLYKDPFSSKANPLADGPPHFAPTNAAPADAPPPTKPHKPAVFITDQQPATTTSALAPSPDELDQKQAEQIEALKKQVQIKMYTKSDDAFSEKVRTYLKKRGYQFVDARP